ncbi:hypothetical protein [uncultured Mucilaginibacter sp.]|uniref:hypothetical protein n=1 Tax=uncultured Mucilaginibacter sp. TaxID=797541 RepID=UPI0025E526B6|nr:hypothetical protein [uncultured Mucilaginibacter sp.]
MPRKYVLVTVAALTMLMQYCQNKPKEQTTQRYEPAPADTTIVYNELSSKVLGRLLAADTNRIKKRFTVPVKISVEEKKENGTEPYYFYTFNSPGNKITLFYKPSEGFYIENGLITKAGITLNKDVVIGMDKPAFLQLLELKVSKFNLFYIVNDDSTVQCSYYFKNNLLSSVKLTQTIE